MQKNHHHLLSSDSFPEIALIVNKSLPASLRPISAALARQLQPSGLKKPLKKGSQLIRTPITPDNLPAPEAILAQEYITALFQGDFNSSGGGSNVGFLNNLIQTIDARMQGISSQIAGNKGSPSTCLSATPQSWLVDLSSLNAMMSLTVSTLQCTSALSGSIAVRCFIWKKWDKLCTGDKMGSYGKWQLC